MATRQDRKKDLDRWLRRVLFSDEKRRCSKIEVYHVTGTKRNLSKIETINEEKLKEELNTLKFDLLSICEMDASGIGGVQSYCLKAFDEEGDDLGRFILRIEGVRDLDGEEELDTEAPTKSGALSQMMRHNEALMKMATLGAQTIIDRQARIIVSQQDTLDKMSGTFMEKFVNSIQLYEELASMSHQRQLESKKEEFHLKLKQESIDQVKLLVPGILNKLAGHEIIPDKTNPVMMSLKRVLDSLSKEQVEHFLGVLNNEQRTAFFDLYEMMAKKDDKGNDKGSDKQGG